MAKLEATINFLANQAEWRTRLKLGGVEELFEKSFKLIVTLLE